MVFDPYGANVFPPLNRGLSPTAIHVLSLRDNVEQFKEHNAMRARSLLLSFTSSRLGFGNEKLRFPPDNHLTRDWK